MLLARVEGLLEGDAGLDEGVAHLDRVLRMDVVVRQAVHDQQVVLEVGRIVDV